MIRLHLRSKLATSALALAFGLCCGLPTLAADGKPTSAADFMMGFPPPQDRQVSRQNWGTPPYVVWAYQNMRALFPTVPVARGAGTVRTLSKRLCPLDTLSFNRPDNTPITWPEFLEDTHADAVIVLYKGKVVEERYLHGMTPDTPHMMFSMSKSFTGLVAEILIAEGKLDETKRVSDYVPELAQSAWGEARVRDVLDMRDGVKFAEDYVHLDSDVARYGREIGLGEIIGGGAYKALAAMKEHANPPGGPFSYKTPATDVAAWVLEKATGQRLSALVSQYVWSRIGAAQDAFYVVDSNGQEVASGGMNARLADLARLALVLQDNGKIGSEQAIPANAIAAIRLGGDRDAFAQGHQPTRAGFSYKSQFWITHNAQGAYTMLGVGGQRLYIEPASTMAVIRFGSNPTLSNAATDAIHANAYAALREALPKCK